MGIVGMKRPPSGAKKQPLMEHILFSVLKAWKDVRLKKYKSRTTLERWTIDRYDTESAVVRIERVPARKTLKELDAELSRPGTVPPGLDSLAWWNTGAVRNEHLDAARLADILNLADPTRDESLEDKILENAVYLVLVHTQADKQGEVTETIVNSFPYTTYVRNLAKKMYENLIFGKEQKKGTP